MTSWPQQRTTAAAVAVSVALVWGALAGGCERRARRTPDHTLVVLVDGKLRNLDPRHTITNNDVKFSRLIMPGLMTIEQPSTEPVPALAQSLEQTGELTWDATLRPGLRFSDGAPVTAQDVVYTFMSTLDPATESLMRPGFDERFVRVEATGELGVRFHLRKPVATLLSDLEFGVVSARAARERGEVIGAGAYRAVEFERDHRLVLERNPHYQPRPGERPAIMPRIDVRIVVDANARAIMLVGGSGDLTQNAIRPDLVESIAQRSRVRVESGPGVVLTYLMMHNEDPALSDVRVRRAIAHAIDREHIIAIKFAGRAVLATGMVPPSHWAYEGEVARYGYDPERAEALLDQAGYPDPDGPGGAPRLTLSYKTSAGDQFRVAIARIIAAQLGRIGIAVEVRAFEFGTFFADIKQGNYQIATMQTAPITEPDYLYTYFHSERIPGPEHPHTHNRWRYRNPRVDQLVTRGRTTMERSQRLGLYSEAQRILARDLPVIPLWHEDNVAVMHVDVEGYQILPSARFGGLRAVSKRPRGL